MQWQNAVGLLSVLSSPAPPAESEGYADSYAKYIAAFNGCREERGKCLTLLNDAVTAAGSDVASVLEAVSVSAVKAVGGVGEWAGVERVNAFVADVSGEVRRAAGSETVQGVVRPVVECVSEPVSCVQRGKNYARNKKRREAAKAAGATRALSVASVCTVDTRTAEEIEAARTLAIRRAVENKIAIARGKHALASLADKSKTEAVKRLAAARMEEQINTAKAKSQASYKKCDTSLKSLGSTGSAGEFALKQEVKRGQEWELKCRYVQAQLDKVFPHVPPEVQQQVMDIPEPTFPSAWEVFGECPADYNDDEREAYYAGLNRMDDETSGFVDPPKSKVQLHLEKQAALDALRERIEANEAARGYD